MSSSTDVDVMAFVARYSVHLLCKPFGVLELSRAVQSFALREN
jgi:hypothetical protein